MQLPRRRLGLRVVVAADVLPVDEDARHGPLACDLEEGRLDGRALVSLVQLQCADRLLEATRSVAARVCLVASVVSGFVIVPELLAATSI